MRNRFVQSSHLFGKFVNILYCLVRLYIPSCLAITGDDNLINFDDMLSIPVALFVSRLIKY